MKKKSFVIGCMALATLSLAFVVYGQTAGQRGQIPAPAATRPVATRPAAPPAPPAHVAQRAVLEEYCIECHNKRSRIANLAIDELNIARVGDNVKEWEKIVRK